MLCCGVVFFILKDEKGHYSNPKPLKTFVSKVLWAAWLGDVMQVQSVLLI